MKELESAKSLSKGVELPDCSSRKMKFYTISLHTSKKSNGQKTFLNSAAIEDARVPEIEISNRGSVHGVREAGGPGKRGS